MSKVKKNYEVKVFVELEVPEEGLSEDTVQDYNDYFGIANDQEEIFGNIAERIGGGVIESEHEEVEGFGKSLKELGISFKIEDYETVNQ